MSDEYHFLNFLSSRGSFSSPRGPSFGGVRTASRTYSLVYLPVVVKLPKRRDSLLLVVLVCHAKKTLSLNPTQPTATTCTTCTDCEGGISSLSLNSKVFPPPEIDESSCKLGSTTIKSVTTESMIQESVTCNWGFSLRRKNYIHDDERSDWCLQEHNGALVGRRRGFLRRRQLHRSSDACSSEEPKLVRRKHQ